MAVDDPRCVASCADARCACAPPRAPALTAVVTTGGLRLVATGPGVLRLSPSSAARAALARADLRGPTSGGFGATWDDALYHELAEALLGQSARGADGGWRLGVSVTPRVISSTTGPAPELWRLQATLGPRVAALLMGAGFVATGRGGGSAMGFGAGLQSEGRRESILGSDVHGGWVAQPFALPASFTRVLVLTPLGTPSAYDGVVRGDTHAFRLVTLVRISEGVVITQRTVLGDARDLLVRVLRRALDSRLPPVDYREVTPPELDDARLLCIHVGATEVASELLRDVRQGRGGWDGEVSTLDGDGFALLCARRATGGATHLVICGGSDYGTFFGVAALLEEAAEAAWVYPGDEGEVVPSRSALGPAVFDRIEEPTVRSRSFTQMSTAAFTAAEVDAMRTWQLCNRLRPVTDRLVLYLQRVRQQQPDYDPNFGRPAGSEAFHYAMLESEARFPTDHALRNLLSPFLPPVMVEVGMATGGRLGDRYRVEGMVWPDLRPRSNLPGTPPFGEPQRGMVSPFVGTVQRDPAYDWTAIQCRGTEAQCPEFQPYDQSTMRPFLSPSGAHRMGVVGAEGGGNVKTMCGYRAEPTPGASAGSIWRFFPLTWRSRIEGDQFPLNDWHPCVFAFDAGLPYGFTLSVHTDLAIDLGNQVRTGMKGRQLRYGEAVHPLAFDDGDNWCTCDACVRSDNTGVNGDLLFHRGHLIATQWTLLEASDLHKADVPGTARPSAGLAGIAYEPSSWNNMDANPFAALTVDQLTLRGVVSSRVSPSNRSRRVLGLLNAVCEEVVAPNPRLFAHVARPATPGFTLPQVSTELDLVWHDVRGPLVTFFAYLSYLAPPIQSPDDQDPSETCHPRLMPYVVGTRDTIEYADSTAAAASDAIPEVEGALARAANWPDQFNQERWVHAGARQLGLYEYLFSASLAVPRNYAARLGNALRWGRRFSIRGFVAEVQPAFALDGPMLWETARLLWNPTVDPTSTGGVPRTAGPIRQHYCDRAFGAGSAAMAEYLRVCEGAWAATRDRWELYFGKAPVASPDRRDNPTTVANYYGRGMAGRGGRLSQLDGWYQPSVRANGNDALTDAWALLREAALATASDPGASARVRRLREGFGLTMLIALWYQPLHQAFLEIRRATHHALFQYVAELFTGKGSPGVARYTVGGAPTPPLPGITEDRTDIVRDAVRTPTLAGVPAVTLPPALVRERTLVDRVRLCIGTELEPGIRQLRVRLHQYLARRDASVMPAYFRAEDRAPYGSEVPLGFGLFEAASPAELRSGDGVWIPRAAPSGPARLAGLNLQAVEDYRRWWLDARTVQMGAEHRLRDDALTDSIVRNVDAPGLGWMFTAIKEMAGVVLLYARDVATSDDVRSRKRAIMNG